MEVAETRKKNTSKAIPITLFVMFVVTALFSPGAAGFFLFASFISFLICRLGDNTVPEPGVEYNLTDWDLPEDNESIIDYHSLTDPLNTMNPTNPMNPLNTTSITSIDED